MKKIFLLLFSIFALTQLALGSPSRSQKHGSSFKLADQQGLTIKENDFDAYGNVTREQDWVSDNFPSEFGGSKNDLLFSTKERDFSTGLDNHGFRYYDATLGKYITRDPIGYPDGPNNYLYVNNNPINSIDPLGLSIWGDFTTWWTDNMSEPFVDSLLTDKNQYLTEEERQEAYTSINEDAKKAKQTAVDEVKLTVDAGMNYMTYDDIFNNATDGTSGEFILKMAKSMREYPEKTFEAGKAAFEEAYLREDYNKAQTILQVLVGLGKAAELGLIVDGTAQIGKVGLEKAYQSMLVNTEVKLFKPIALEVSPKVNLNLNSSVSVFGIYEIKINGVLYKIGKADLARITQSS